LSPTPPKWPSGTAPKCPCLIGEAYRLGFSWASYGWSPQQRAEFLDKLKAATRAVRPREKLATALTGAERAKRARLKKKGERLPPTPRAEERDDITTLHFINNYGKDRPLSKRTLYRRRRVAHELIEDPKIFSRLANAWKAYDGNEKAMKNTVEMFLIACLTVHELLAFEKQLPELSASDVPECDAFVMAAVELACDGYRESGVAGVRDIIRNASRT
jgi:hypothetical protein